jgi:hypothetical protein
MRSKDEFDLAQSRFWSSGYVSSQSGPSASSELGSNPDHGKCSELGRNCYFAATEYASILLKGNYADNIARCDLLSLYYCCILHFNHVCRIKIALEFQVGLGMERIYRKSALTHTDVPSESFVQ